MSFGENLNDSGTLIYDCIELILITSHHGIVE